MGSSDLSEYFGEDPVLETGICSGSAIHFIKHYCTAGDLFGKNYTNEIAKDNAKYIITLQKYCRVVDKSAAACLSELGMRTVGVPLKISTVADIEKHLSTILSESGTGTISYTDPPKVVILLDSLSLLVPIRYFIFLMSRKGM